MNKIAPLLASAALLMLVHPAAAQKQPTASKKIYCWDEGGRKVCGDALPAEAVDNARTEFNASGIATRRLDRAPTDAERVAAEAEAERERAAAAAAAAELRRELAMVESYASEAELRAAFAHRIGMLDASVKTSQLSVEGLRNSLVTLLRRAGEAELADRAVPKPLAGNIQVQHQALRRQQILLADQLRERTAVDEDLGLALERYRELKQTGDADRG
jgi:hypothetical protein